MRSLPKTLQKYENRGKNVFPEMILCAEHYAQSVSNKLFSTPNQMNQQNDKRNLYYNILLYSYISGICCGHHRAKICENSIKKGGNLKRLLQKYFDGNEIQSYSFPKHLQDVIDYFKNKYHETLNEFQTKYTHRITTTNASIYDINNNNNSNNNYGGIRVVEFILIHVIILGIVPLNNNVIYLKIQIKINVKIIKIIIIY